MSNRGLDELELAVEQQNLIVPGTDYNIGNHDKIDCRIIKFGSRNEKFWKGKDGKPDNTTLHIKTYIKVNSWFKAETQDHVGELPGQVILINPRVAWIPELVALQRSLAEETGDKGEIFKHNIEIFRNDKKNPKGEGHFGYLVVTDKGQADDFDDNELEYIKDAPQERETDRVVSKPTPTEDRPASKTSEQQKAPQQKVQQAKTNPFDGCETIESALQILRDLYDKSNPDQNLVKQYKAKRALLLSDLVRESKTPVETAKTLSAKWLGKEPESAADLAEYGKTCEKNLSNYDSDEDLPF